MSFFMLLMVCGSALAQKKTDDAKIKSMGDKACDCCSEISVDQPKDSIVSSINECIRSITTASQLEDTMQSLMEAVEKTESSVEGDTTVVGDGRNIVIYMDENFDEIQEYMFRNCKAVKFLMNSNNTKTELSMSKNKKALEYYKEGQDYSSEEKYDMAVVSFNKAVKADPKFVFAWDNLGISYRKMGNYKEAIKCYQKSLEIDPKGTMPLQNMAVAYEFLKDYKQSAATYVKFIDLYPDNPEGYFGAGRVFYISEEYAKGVDNMFKAYLLYEEAKSPYINDALQNLRYYYSDLEKKGKLDIFKEAAKNNNIDLD